MTLWERANGRSTVLRFGAVARSRLPAISKRYQSERKKSSHAIRRFNCSPLATQKTGHGSSSISFGEISDTYFPRVVNKLLVERKVSGRFSLHLDQAICYCRSLFGEVVLAVNSSDISRVSIVINHSKHPDSDHS